MYLCDTVSSFQSYSRIHHVDQAQEIHPPLLPTLCGQTEWVITDACKRTWDDLELYLKTVVSHHAGTRNHTWALLQKKPVCLTAEPALQLLLFTFNNLKGFQSKLVANKGREAGKAAQWYSTSLCPGVQSPAYTEKREEAYKLKNFYVPFGKALQVFFNNSRPNMKYFCYIQHSNFNHSTCTCWC